jgi:hypothetical protein
MKRLALMLCLFPVVVGAAEVGEAVGFRAPVKNDVEEYDWAEEAVELPAFPKEADLVEFPARSPSTARFYVDGSTLSIGKDRVVHYVLVIKTSGGARNVSFEGIRCATSEYKIYATGRADGQWAKSQLGVWRPIENKTTNAYHASLNRDFLCPIANPIGSPEEGRDALRRGKHPLVP